MAGSRRNPDIRNTSTARRDWCTCIACGPWWTSSSSASAPPIADDPQLTVRRVCGAAAGARRYRSEGPAWRRRQDVRRRRRAPSADHRARHTRCTPPAVSKLSRCPTIDGQFAPSAILAALAGRGMRRMLIEGGADTVSRFLVAGCLDRLHVMVAPDHPGWRRARHDPAVARPRRSGASHARCACIRSTTMCCSTAICRLSACRSA